MSWKATTKSGRVYEEHNGGVRVSGQGYFPQPTMRSFPSSSIDDLSTPEGKIDWEKINALPKVERPVEGEHFYISCFGDAGWRISTPIKTVEDV